MLSYEATAGRADGTPYKALVSSGYARHGPEWKMAFHQQTPLESKPPSLEADLHRPQVLGGDLLFQQAHDVRTRSFRRLPAISAASLRPRQSRQA